MLNISDWRLQAEETAYAANSREIQTNVTNSSILTIADENATFFKKGIVADYPSTGYDELIFENVHQ